MVILSEDFNKKIFDFILILFSLLNTVITEYVPMVSCVTFNFDLKGAINILFLHITWFVDLIPYFVVYSSMYLFPDIRPKRLFLTTMKMK